MDCESCDTFRQQGHNFCGICGNAIDAIPPQAPTKPIQDAVADKDLQAWIEQGWTIQTLRPCQKCGNPQTCSRVEVVEKEKGYNPGTTISCNPLIFLAFLLMDGVIKMCYPPRILTMNVDRMVCPRCKNDQYENSRVVSERRM